MVGGLPRQDRPQQCKESNELKRYINTYVVQLTTIMNLQDFWNSMHRTARTDDLATATPAIAWMGSSAPFHPRQACLCLMSHGSGLHIRPSFFLASLYWKEAI